MEEDVNERMGENEKRANEKWTREEEEEKEEEEEEEEEEVFIVRNDLPTHEN